MSEETTNSGEPTAEKDDARHAMKMAKKKTAREKIMATKTDEKGLIIVHTGKGKGKSTAGFGMIFRHIAHGISATSASSTPSARASPGKRRIAPATWRWRRKPGNRPRN
jgi:cob(I)alamin adenosyltransferase